MSDAEFEAPACSAGQVVERMACLGNQLILLYQEQAWASGTEEERTELAEIYDVVSRHLLTDRELTPDERRLAEKPIGTWTAADRMNVGWTMEAVVVMAWALSLLEAVPPFDVMADDWGLLETFNTPAKVEELEQQQTLRPREELDGFLGEAEGWHWCARQAESYISEPISERQRETLRRALRRSVSLYGKPYEALTYEELCLARSIAQERHRAIQWIWNGGPWDEVTTDT